MKRKEFVRSIVDLLKESNIKKSVHVPRHRLYISDDTGTTKAFTVKGADKEIAFTSADVGAVVDAAIKVILDTVSEPDKTIGSETYTAKVFMPRLEQMYINPQAAGEGEAWDYYKQLAQGAGLSGKFQQWQTYPILISYALENHTSAQFVRLASAYRGNSYYTWYVNSSGYVYGNGAATAYRCRPACVI